MKCRKCNGRLTMRNASHVRFVCRECNRKDVKSRIAARRRYADEYRSIDPGVSFTDWVVSTGRARRYGSKLMFVYA